MAHTRGGAPPDVGSCKTTMVYLKLWQGPFLKTNWERSGFCYIWLCFPPFFVGMLIVPPPEVADQLGVSNQPMETDTIRADGKFM